MFARVLSTPLASQKHWRRLVRDHSLNTFAKFSQNYYFLSPDSHKYPLIRTSTVAYQGVKNNSFGKILRTYLMNDPLRKTYSLIFSAHSLRVGLDRFSLRFDSKTPNCGSKKFTKMKWKMNLHALYVMPCFVMFSKLILFC